MCKSQPIAVVSPPDQKLNGLGMMVSQYVEQVLEEFPDKTRYALGIRNVISMEMEKGIAVTISFQGDRVTVENGVARRPDLHIKGSYVVLAGVLSGKVNPVLGVIRRTIRIKGIPRRPFQSLKVMKLLKVPAPSPTAEVAP